MYIYAATYINPGGCQSWDTLRKADVRSSVRGLSLVVGGYQFGYRGESVAVG